MRRLGRTRFCHLLQRPCLLMLLFFHTMSQAQRLCLRRAKGAGATHWTFPDPLAGLHCFSCLALFIPRELSPCNCCHGNWSQGHGRGAGLWRRRKTCRIGNFPASEDGHRWPRRCLNTPSTWGIKHGSHWPPSARGELEVYWSRICGIHYTWTLK